MFSTNGNCTGMHDNILYNEQSELCCLQTIYNISKKRKRGSEIIPML